MGLDPGFRSLLTHAVILNRRTGTDTFGNPTYGPDEPIIAFVVEQSVRHVGPDTNNQQRQGPDTDAQIITDVIYPDADDLMTLPSGKVAKVITVETYRDEGDDVMHQVGVQTQGSE